MLKTKSKFLQALLINVTVLALTLIFFRPFFESNDENVYMTLVNGARVTRDAHLVYQNYLFGLILKGLYMLPGRLPWYSITLCVIAFAAFTAVTYVILKLWEGYAGYAVSIALLLIFDWQGYISIQFTRVAGYASAAGLLLIYAASFSIRDVKIRRRMIIFGIVLGTFGFLIRWMQFGVTFIALGGILIYELLRSSFKDVFLKLIKPVGILALICILAFAADKASYKLDPVWNDYIAFDNARHELYDYGFPSRTEFAQEYDALGLDDTAMAMLKHWNFADPEKFDTEVAEKLVSLKHKKSLSMATLKKFVHTYPWILRTNIAFLTTLLLALLWLLFAKHSKADVIAAIAQVVIMGAIHFLLFYSGRYNFQRVDVPLWFAAALVVLYVTKAKKPRFYCLGSLLTVVLIWAFLLHGSNMHSRLISNEKAVSKQTAMRLAMEEIAADSEHLYLGKLGTVSTLQAYMPYDSMPEGIMNNLIYMGGWASFTGQYWATVDRYGVSNPFRDCVDSDTILLIDQDIETTLSYIRTWYAPQAKAEPVEMEHVKNVYRIVTK